MNISKRKKRHGSQDNVQAVIQSETRERENNHPKRKKLHHFVYSKKSILLSVQTYGFTEGEKKEGRRKNMGHHNTGGGGGALGAQVKMGGVGNWWGIWPLGGN